LGLSQYNTGKPCPKGHISDRYTGNGNCVQCQRVVNAENNKKHQKIKDEYYDKNREIINEKRRAKYKLKKSSFSSI
jgi:hypothetical protein